MRNILISLFIVCFFCGTLNASAKRRVNTKSSSVTMCLDLLHVVLNSKSSKRESLSSNSLGAKIPKYESTIELISRSNPNPSLFIKVFSEKMNRSPNVREVVEYLIHATREFHTAVNLLESKDFHVSNLISKFRKKVFLDKKRVKNLDNILLKTNYDLLNSPVPHAGSELLREIKMNRYLVENRIGDIGEFDFLLSHDNILDYGIKIGDFADHLSTESKILTQIKRSFSKAFESIHINSLQDYKEYSEKFPNIFPLVLLDIHNNSIEKVLKMVKERASSKEIDFLIKEDRKFLFVELKSTRKVTTLKKIKQPRSGKGSHKISNTIIKQHMFMVELLKFIEVDDVVDYAIFFRNGIEKDAKNLLENSGGKVMGEVF